MIWKVLKYSFSDLIRSRWSYVYLTFYLVLGFVLLFLNQNLSKAVITIMNIVVVLTPLIGTIFGIMYYYNSREFVELLLAQPIRRSTIFIGQYLGVAFSLSLSLVVGLGIPFLIYGLTQSDQILNFVTLIVSGVFLTFIFTGISIYLGLLNSNKIKGFGYAILMWLFFAVIYDGILLILLIVFEDYPLDKFTLISSFFNPINLSRIMILLKLDISALLGYTGAVFQKFFGTGQGMFIALGMLTLWVIGPMLLLVRESARKDF
jgi:Cu-processing system permease protein